MKLTGRKWASQFIQAIWKFTHSLWRNRNHVLHQDHGHDIVMDLTSLNQQVEIEWNRGSAELHPIHRIICPRG
jgi:hypothetical protein